MQVGFGPVAFQSGLVTFSSGSAPWGMKTLAARHHPHLRLPQHDDRNAVVSSVFS